MSNRELRSGIGSHQRAYQGESDCWLTPPELLRSLGPFDLDPCACDDPRPWPTAATHYTKIDNGLAMPWHGRVWLNPPYGPETGKWLERLARHGDGMALIFARTETAMFHQWVWKEAAGVLFLNGRLHFHRPDGTRAENNAGGPSCVIAYGAACALKLQQAGLDGKYVPLFHFNDDNPDDTIAEVCRKCGNIVTYADYESNPLILEEWEPIGNEALCEICSTTQCRTEAPVKVAKPESGQRSLWDEG